MRTVVTGATGFIGKGLVARLRERGHSVATVSRSAEKARSIFGSDVRCLAWGDTAALRIEVAEADAVCHLAGASVAGERWTPAYKREIRQSRTESTRQLVEAGPRVLVSASAVGYYGGCGDDLLTEESGAGEDFLADVCVRWEAAARQAESGGGRVALVRIGQVLGKGGGTLDAILNPPIAPVSPFRLGLGGMFGSGRQWMPWVHLSDVLRLFVWCVETESARGPYNAVSPNPVTNREFTETLGRVLRRPTAIPVPAIALRALLGEFAEYVLYSQRVVPRRTTEQGFRFRFPRLEDTLRDLLEN
ncbi:MAG: TIGR01777 family oxidoreductase [Capsulimonadales bacterium]|nr:TIGR01777 family oxidoreductase [Capsulimonadales bacterium]